MKPQVKNRKIGDNHPQNNRRKVIRCRKASGQKKSKNERSYIEKGDSQDGEGMDTA